MANKPNLLTEFPDIAKEWDYEKNIGLKPEMITPRNGRKVWWKCEKGHSYEATVANRTGGRGCPFCVGKKVLIGYNDLATTYPEIAKEWDHTKNKSLTPQNVTKGCNKKVWWLCERGHSYEQSPNNRTHQNVGCPFCSNKKVLPGYNDLATTCPEIAKEWDYQKNGSLTPQNITKGSETKIWWLCEKGHSYVARTANRTNGFGCPFCAGQKILIGYNDLATTHPEIAKEWDYHKNRTLTPQEVSKGNKTKVWWKCKKGHEYKATITSRIKGCGCPICSGHKILIGYNDLATTYPELTTEWDYHKNKTLTPQKVTKGCNKKVWWLCERGHSYKTTIATRTEGGGCPICSGKQIQIGFNDLATTHPEIAKEWDYTKNKSLTPQNVTRGSETKVWWICEKGHSYETKVINRTAGNGCPYCSGQKVLIGYNDLATVHPEIAKEWDYENNFDLKPEMFTAGSGKKVWWKCPMNHSYIAMIAKRTGEKTGCPVCSASIGEKTIYKVLNDLNLKCQMQVTFDELTGIKNGKLRYDFGIYENDKLLFLIEYQGRQHYDEIDLFGGEKYLEKQQFHDDLKREYAKKYLNVPLLEIPYEITEYADIFNRIKDFYNITTNKRG